MAPLYEQPMIKLLQILSPTINWLDTKGTVEVAEVPSDHLDAIKQLERIGIVHKRNNRCYELQKIRLKKLMGSIGIESLSQVPAPAPAPAPSPVATQPVPAAMPPVVPPVAPAIPLAPLPAPLGTSLEQRLESVMPLTPVDPTAPVNGDLN